MSSAAILAHLTGLYTSADGAQLPYGTSAGHDLAIDPLASSGSSRAVTFLEHALQTAALAASVHADDDELVAAALLHDIGWLLPRPSDPSLLTAHIARHDETGARYLEFLGFSARTCALVGAHVAAKRFLVSTEPAYAASLSAGSTATLALQGGAMSCEEAREWAAMPHAALARQLRRWEEAAKVVGATVPPWSAYEALLHRVLARARFAPFSALGAGTPRALEALLPRDDARRVALSESGPGYAVIRGWLSAAELAALQRYARDVVPAAPASDAFHTYERTAAGAVALSRTEHFAHIGDEEAVGARLLLARDGRLAELCAALRGGRRFSLYKEKVNYKVAGGSGGYLPHQDFYPSFDGDGRRRGPMADADVCVVMLAIDDMDGDNGCPEVAPGWHARGPLAFRGSAAWSHGEAAGAALTAADPAELPWTPVHLSAGDALVYGNMMPHRSAPNASARDRRALFAVFADCERHGDELRRRYYEDEARGRRADGSAREKGKSNIFFTGEPVLSV